MRVPGGAANGSACSAAPFSAPPSATAPHQPDEHFELDGDERQYKPGFWKQATAFLAGARSGQPPRFAAASLADAHRTMQLIDGICQLPAEVEEDVEQYLPMTA